MFLVLFASVLPTGAGEFKSVYTSLKLEDCVELTSGQEDEQSQSQGDGEWVCNGHERIAVWVARGHLRYSLGYGSHGREMCVRRQRPWTN